MRGINIDPAVKHSRSWIGGELIHDQRICGQAVADGKESGKRQCQQMECVALHISISLGRGAHFKPAFAADIPRRAADHNLESARLHNERAPFDIIVRQLIGGQ